MVILSVSFHQFNYYANDEFYTFSFYLRSDEVVDNVTIDNIDDVMRAAHQNLYSCMDDERSIMNFEGVKNIRLKLIIDEPE